MKKLLLLLDSDVRRILILLMSTSIDYDTLLVKTQLSEATLDTLLQKLLKNKMIFVSNHTYYIHTILLRRFKKASYKCYRNYISRLHYLILSFFPQDHIKNKPIYIVKC